MRISRLYLPVSFASGEQVELDEDSAHYLRTVLRLKKSADITVFNGQGGEWQGTVIEIHRKRVVISVSDWVDRSAESPLKVILGQAVSRSDRMDMAVQKAVELGVNRISPLLTERCVVQLKGEKTQHKMQHWNRIVQNAAEQSGRTLLPEVDQPAVLDQWVSDQDGLKIFLDPHADQSLPELQPQTGQVTLLSGPEGGFTDQERQIAKDAGFVPIKLGKRILRTETASLTALAAVQLLWGDIGVESSLNNSWHS